jgi:hypothetical protein
VCGGSVALHYYRLSNVLTARFPCTAFLASKEFRVFCLAPSGWGLVICHGTGNAAYVRRIVKGTTTLTHEQRRPVKGAQVRGPTFSVLLTHGQRLQPWAGWRHVHLKTYEALADNVNAETYSKLLVRLLLQASTG